MSSPRLARLAAFGLAAATIIVPMSSASAVTQTGHITKPAPGGLGVTDNEFVVTCPAAPATQGVDGWVFALATAAGAGDTVSIKGSSAAPFSLATYVYKSDCTYSRAVTSGLNNIVLEAGDKYFSSYAPVGADVNVTFSSPAATSTSGPNDPLFLQSGEGDLFTGGQWNMRKVRAPEAWVDAKGAGVTVAVLDSGLDISHPDFNCANKVSIVNGSDMVDGDSTPEDENGHGTHVAGIVGACTNNGIGVVGVAPDVTIMPIRVLDETGSGTADMLVDGIRKAVDEGADVINMSIGFSLAGAPATGGLLGFTGFWADIDAAIKYAVDNGVVVISTSGNDSSPICGYPAIAYNVICVGATDPMDQRTWYTGAPVKDDDEDLTGPAMTAPGGRGVILFCDFSSSEIISTYDRGADTTEGDCDGLHGYASIQGTSMAAPMVAGAAALVYGWLGGTRSPADAAKVTEALLNGSADLASPGWDPVYGAGRLDARGSVDYAIANF